MMIQMTEKAAEHFKEVVQARSLPENTMLRVDTERGQKEGEVRISLKLDTQEPRPEDEVQTTQGARLAVDRNLAQALGDSMLDFEKKAGGFVFARSEPMT